MSTAHYTASESASDCVLVITHSLHAPHAQGAEIVRMTDQDNTDFTKTLQYLITLLEAKELEVRTVAI